MLGLYRNITRGDPKTPGLASGRAFSACVCVLTLSLLLGGWFIPAAIAMNLVRAETRVDDAVARYGVTGSNTLVAILDRGLDWHHVDFRNADGTTRIEFIFDLTDNSGASDPGNTYAVGTIYTKAQIDDALQNDTPLATRDAVGHGTTTAGIACGGGRLNPLYRGIAPGARIIVVKITSDGAPAHDGEPEELPFYSPELIPIAIDFVTDKAAALGLPCVMLLNIGSVGGPTDGTSALCRKVNETVGPGKPGLAFVTGTSDDGGAANRAGGTVNAGQALSLQIEKAGGDPLVCDLWYSETDRFDVEIVTPNGTFGPYIAPANDTAYDSRTTPDFFYYHLGAGVEPWGATSAKREIYVRLDGPAGTYQIQLTGATVTSGCFDATLNPSRFDPDSAPISRFKNCVLPGSIWDLATASNNICPNSYVILTNYVDIDHVARTVPNEGEIGGLWNGSGVGPTFDGRIGLDISAPGNSLFTTYSPQSYWATFRFNLIEGGNTNYGRAGAVSAANPIVTGIISLMLEMDVTLDAARIKRILQASARGDAFTGATPNATWGYGKVDALAALDIVYEELHHAATHPINDYNGDGTSDLALYNEAYGTWYVVTPDFSPILWGTALGGPGFMPVTGDYNGDGTNDLALYNETHGTWYVVTPDFSPILWGATLGGPGFTPVSGDYNGDGISDLALYNEAYGTWYIVTPDFTPILWGTALGGPGFTPISGDYNGDGISDLALYNEAYGTWYIVTPDFTPILWGTAMGGPGFSPVSGDYNGDETSDLALYNEACGTWYIVTPNLSPILWGTALGGPGFTPVNP